MLEVTKATSRVVGGQLQVQIDLKGDLPGHPFRGNQWEGGAGGEHGAAVSGEMPEEKPAGLFGSTQVAGVAAAQVHAVLDDLTTRFPRIGKMIEHVRTRGQRELSYIGVEETLPESRRGISVGKGTTGAYYQGSILVQGKSIEDGPLSLGKFTVDNSTAGTLRHEFAHYLDDVRSGISSGLSSKPGDEIFRAGRPLLKEVIKELGGKVGSKVSKYAKEDQAEFFAEAFAAYTHPSYGKEGTPRLPPSVEDYMKRAIG